MTNAGFDPAFFMNIRLKTILDCIDPDSCGVADVGTDHGILPVTLALNGFHGNILASDIREGPLRHAMDTAKEKDVADRIRFFLCDGLLEEFSELVDTIVIAGMGGDMICSIIDRADWLLDSHYTLILQPMTKAEVLRYYLTNNGFEIRKEHHVPDRTHLYSVIITNFTGQNTLSPLIDLYTGRQEDYMDPDLYRRSLEKLLTEAGKKTSAQDAKHLPETEYYRELTVRLTEALNELTGRDHGNKE